MIKIIKADTNHAELLSGIARQSFIESHAISASETDISNYINSKLTIAAFETELKDVNNHFHILYFNEKPTGYSKIIFNFAQDNLPFKNVTKLERIYVLEEFHHLKLGLHLFTFNLELSKNNQQSGMWLYVWTENQKAINFYKKAGFEVVGRYDFKISETHSNPNHQMLLSY
ncbi:GNAT family N-acetyltransferase [Bizionia myxarmorum]|uniref:GNAT family N-acetyltransferase n=1 Tax=Bizionia myxarmorum TaxID=291186 RepID=A0A5D0QY95_9FLAO|nr:GNAT family N-acetyltransferase [Bizionia myxarmorum]TYB73184.1 GNAT family N-acetyltransferase [Bizionia myxarmorum]